MKFHPTLSPLQNIIIPVPMAMRAWFVTRYTNSQNAVREKDFLALTSDFCSWQTEMASKYDIYLEIQRGVFGRMMEGLAAQGSEPKTVMIDATYLKAHRTASSLGVKKGISDACSDGPKAARTRNCTPLTASQGN